jgi:hypothetical protein
VVAEHSNVALQQSLPLQKAPDAPGDGVRQFGELGGGRGPHPAKPLDPSTGPNDVDPIQEQHMEVEVQVQRTAEALDQRHRAGARRLAGESGLPDRVAGDDPIDDAELVAVD